MIDLSLGNWVSKGSLIFSQLYAETPFTFSSNVVLADCTTLPSTDSYYLIGDSYQIFEVNGKSAISNWKPLNGQATLLMYSIETSPYKLGIFLKTWIQDCTVDFWEWQL